MVHCSPEMKLTSGVMIQFCGPDAEMTVVCGPELAHSRLYQVPVTSTGSLKNTEMLASIGAGVLANASESVSVLETAGGASSMIAVRLGFGWPVKKSAEF